MKPSNPGTKKQTCVEYSCALCSYSTEILGRYKSHLITHTNKKPFKCPECPFKSKRESCVKQHLKDVHVFRSSSSRPFACQHPGCNYAAKQKSTLTRHSKIHSGEKSFSCSHPNCNYSTNLTQSLIYHTRVHTGEKPFVCQFESCSFAFARQANLLNHMRTHTKEKPYKCPELNCEYSFTQMNGLKRHQLIHHPKEGEERPSFPCPLCEYKGKSKDHLSSHIKRHTLEKLFNCDEPNSNCNYEAKSKTHLKTHKAVHSDEKPFVCPLESCKYRCKQKSHLSTHLKTHSEERPYKCELCPYRGKTRNVVIQHLKQVHSDPTFSSAMRQSVVTQPKETTK